MISFGAMMEAMTIPMIKIFLNILGMIIKCFVVERIVFEMRTNTLEIPHIQQETKENC